MLGDGLLRAEWNKALIRDIIAPCWARLIVKSCTGKTIKEEEAYTMWPFSTSSASWNILLVQTLLSLLVKEKVLYTTASGGKWLLFNEAILLPQSNSTGFNENYYLFIIIYYGYLYYLLYYHLFIISTFYNIEINNKLATMLLADQWPVVILPPSLHSFLVNNKVITNIATPAYVSKLIMENAKDFSKSLSNLSTVSFLLDYVVINNIDINAAHKLVGLPLLPLLNNTVGFFDLFDNKVIKKPGQPALVTYYICDENEEKILKEGASHLVVSNEHLSEYMKKFLSNSIVQQTLNVKVCIKNYHLSSFYNINYIFFY